MRGSGHAQNNQVSILYTNIRSVLKNRDSLSSAIGTCSAHIIALTETWLSNDIQDSELFHDSKQFTIYRCDRTERRGGGVLLALSKRIPSSPIHISTNLESVWATATLNHQKVILGVCYRPPSSSPAFTNELHDIISTITTKFPSTPLFLFGDFNFPNIVWNSDIPNLLSSSSDSKDFLGICTTFSLTQLVTQATRSTSTSANILDLILTNRPDYASTIHYLPGISDHLLLNIHFNTAFVKLPKTKK